MEETTRCYQVRRIVELSDLSSAEQREKAYSLLHQNWTKAVGNPNYDKRQWNAILHIIWAAEKDAEGFTDKYLTPEAIKAQYLTPSKGGRITIES